jgi:hypothetical protein
MSERIDTTAVNQINIPQKIKARRGKPQNKNVSFRKLTKKEKERIDKILASTPKKSQKNNINIEFPKTIKLSDDGWRVPLGELPSKKGVDVLKFSENAENK